MEMRIFLSYSTTSGVIPYYGLHWFYSSKQNESVHFSNLDRFLKKSKHVSTAESFFFLEDIDQVKPPVSV